MTHNSEYQVCTRCVMDTTDRDIVFDEHGVCNHCKQADERIAMYTFDNDAHRQRSLDEYVEDIKKRNKNKPYDCIIGISGGIDSSYLAHYVVKELGLRPLAFHMDNGWNSELAIKNIEKLVNELNIDLYTHVIDWEEFKELQKAFFKASVVDLEMLTENAIWVQLYRYSRKFKINDFILGMNVNTETIMPSSWLYSAKYDGLNIKSIYKAYGTKMRFSTYHFLPSFFAYLRFKYRTVQTVFPLLNYVNYNKTEALDFLKKEYDWKDYGGKHYESLITYFYQVYILPEKFNIDKRKAHFSSLVVSGLMTRDEALNELAQPMYQANKIEELKSYFIKKLELTEEEFEQAMATPERSHYDFDSYEGRILRIRSSLEKYGFMTFVRKIKESLKRATK